MLRVVCRNGFSEDLADLFLDALRSVVTELEGNPHRRRPGWEQMAASMLVEGVDDTDGA